MGEQAVNNVHFYYKILYIHEVEVYRKLWRSYSSLKVGKCRMGGEGEGEMLWGSTKEIN